MKAVISGLADLSGAQLPACAGDREEVLPADLLTGLGLTVPEKDRGSGSPPEADRHSGVTGEAGIKGVSVPMCMGGGAALVSNSWEPLTLQEGFGAMNLPEALLPGLRVLWRPASAHGARNRQAAPRWMWDCVSQRF